MPSQDTGSCPPCREPERDPCACDEAVAISSVGPVPQRKYRTIVVDPPWAYNDASYSRRARNSTYVCMSLGDMAALPISEWAEDDAHIYLWTTNGFMEEAHQIARAWGVKQKTIVTWRKPQIGAGRYYRNNTEHVLFCVKGRLPCLRSDMPTCFTAPRGRHSEKPAAFYDIVESMSPGPYLDVFARKLRFNWDAWGDEVGAPEGLPTPQQLADQRQAALELGGAMTTTETATCQCCGREWQQHKHSSKTQRRCLACRLYCNHTWADGRPGGPRVYVHKEYP